MSLAIGTQVFRPAGLYSKATLATPAPPSDAVASSGVAGPPIVWPASGDVSEPVGFVLSTRTVTIGLVPVWPAWSVAIARSS